MIIQGAKAIWLLHMSPSIYTFRKEESLEDTR